MKKWLCILLLIMLTTTSLGSVSAEMDDMSLRVLILGIDAYDDSTRSDMMMLMQIESDASLVRMVSIARDTYVYLPEKGFSDRINTAYRYGDATSAMETIRANWDIEVTDYVVVNFAGFTDIVDAIGGVDLVLDSSEVSTIASACGRAPQLNLDFTYHIDGEQSLAFVRIRKLDSDFGRTERQRRLLLATAQKIKGQWSVDLFTSLLSSLLSCIETNIEVGDALTLMGAFTGDVQSISHQELSIPVQGKFSYETIDGKSVIALSETQWQENREILHAFLSE